MADEEGGDDRGSARRRRDDEAVDGDLSKFAKYKRRVVRDYLKVRAGRGATTVE